MKPPSRLVYSTRFGRACPRCGQPAAECACGSGKQAPPSDGVVRVRREVKGRHGKTVTTVSGVPLGGEALADLAADLKRLCGSGGSVKDGVIVIQGEKTEIVIAELEKRGFTVKRAGG